MKITTQHPYSHHGVPVILSDISAYMPHAEGIRAIRRHLSLSVRDLAARCGVSPRTVEGWEQGRPVPAAALNVMGDLLRSSAVSRRA